ncbi:MAG: PPP family 3-phenylpropionic acid transporter [Bradymonadia bacterium]|jgi:PPP family 3-phenylpropionic acid transporter
MYFTYLGGVGIAVTYWPYHFEAIGLSKSDIGLIFAVRMAMGVISQPLLTRFSDRWGRPALMLFISLSITCCLSVGMLFADDFLPIALVMWLSAPFAAVFVPLTDATTVRLRGLAEYGGIRLWGSVGFGLGVAVFGLAVRGQTHAEAGALAVPAFLGFSAACAALCGVLQLGEARPASKPQPKPFTPGWLFVPFVLANALHWSCVTLYNVYFALHTESLGMSPSIPGLCVAVATMGEVLAFAFASRFLGGRASVWVAAACLVSALRWWVISTTTSVEVLIVVQALHFFSFGVWFSFAIKLLGRFAPPERRATVQGLFSAACFGVGGSLGSLIGGRIMEAHGGSALFLVAVGLEVAAAAVFLVTLPRLPAPLDSIAPEPIAA